MSRLPRITAVILAGGLGTRLREAVADRPKVLAEVNGRPFLAYLLDRLADAGVRRVVLCTGYMAELVSDAFGDSYRGMVLLYSREDQALGTGGALRLALPLIASELVLVMNGDSFCDANLKLFFEQHSSVSATASLVLAKVADVSRYGTVDTDGTGAITSFVEKGGRQGEGMINAGIYLLVRSVIESIPSGCPVSLEGEAFQGLIGKGLYGFPQPTCFIDIGIPADYHAAAAVLHASDNPASSGETP
jgi:D-glycero-alpha-D-manno-heptose 1-phosphate guanylyltransferase